MPLCFDVKLIYSGLPSEGNSVLKHAENTFIKDKSTQPLTNATVYVLSWVIKKRNKGLQNYNKCT